MKTIIILLFLLSASLLPAEDSRITQLMEKSEQENTFELSDGISTGDLSLLERRLNFFSLGLLTGEELRLLRNMIYAKAGYVFQSQSLNDHFRQFDWYRPVNNNNEIELSSLDRRNIHDIRSFEGIDRQQNDILSYDQLIGLWHKSLIMPSGFAEVFQFYGNGGFKYRFSQMRELPIIDSIEGHYRIEGNALVLSLKGKYLHSGDDDIEYSGAFGHQWKNSRLEYAEYQRTIVLPITSVFKAKDISGPGALPDELGEREAINIGEITYFLYSADPDSYH